MKRRSHIYVCQKCLVNTAQTTIVGCLSSPSALQNTSSVVNQLRGKPGWFEKINTFFGSKRWTEYLLEYQFLFLLCNRRCGDHCGDLLLALKVLFLQLVARRRGRSRSARATPKNRNLNKQSDEITYFGIMLSSAPKLVVLDEVLLRLFNC